jgi:spore germination protein GerM
MNIPKINSLKIRNRVLYLNFSSRNNFSEYDSEILYILVNTLTSIDGVDGVLFLVDGKKVDNLLGNENTINIFYNNYSYAYLSYDYNGRNLLVPTNVAHMDKVIKVLKSDKDELKGVMPKGVELLDYSITQDTITLNFNKNFLKAYNDRPDLKNMLIDSLNYSYTSFEEINNLEIKVDGKKITTFGDYDLSVPMKGLSIINP